MSIIDHRAPSDRDPAWRVQLPARRQQKIRRVEYTLLGSGATQKIYVAVGYLPLPAPDGGRVLEVFLHGAGRVGSERDGMLDKLAVLISLTLQLGISPRRLRDHLAAGELSAYCGDLGRATDVIGVVVDQIIAMQEEITVEIAAVPQAQWEAFLGDRS